MNKLVVIIMTIVSILAFSSSVLAQRWLAFDTKGEIGSQVTDITVDKNGNLWISTFGDGVGRREGGRWIRFSTEDGLASDRVFTVLQDSKGRLWFSTDLGVSKYEEGDWNTYTEKDGLAGPSSIPILEDRSGNVWVGSSSGVSRYDGREWTSYKSRDFLANKTQAIVEDRDGNLWFGTYGGVIKFNRVSWITYNRRSGLVSDFVTALMVDRAGNLWVGTLGGGLSRYNGSNWTTVIPAAPKGDETPISVSDILEDRQGNIWLGVSGKGIMRYDGNTWVTFGRKDGLISEEVNTLYEDREGNLWVGTWEGISRLEGISGAAPLPTSTPTVANKPDDQDEIKPTPSEPLQPTVAKKQPVNEEVETTEVVAKEANEGDQVAVALKDEGEEEKTRGRSFWSRIGLRRTEGSESAQEAQPEPSPSPDEKEVGATSAEITEEKVANLEEKPRARTPTLKELAVEAANTAVGISNHNPVGVADSFPRDVGRIYLWSRIINGADTTIKHIWYHQGSRMAAVELNIGSNRFRTYSSKTIFPSSVGDWRVDIVDEAGNLLESLSFVVTDQEG